MKMSPNQQCRELPFEELILLARHAGRVSGYITLKSLSEYFPSLDINTHLLILESLLESRRIRRVSRGRYAFIELDKSTENKELEEELSALADAKRLVQERVRLNLPASVLHNGENTSNGNGHLEIDINGNNHPAHVLQDSRDFYDPETIPRNSSFTTDSLRSKQGIKRKHDRSVARPNTSTPLLSSPASPTVIEPSETTIPSESPIPSNQTPDLILDEPGYPPVTDAAPSDLVVSMAELQLNSDGSTLAFVPENASAHEEVEVLEDKTVNAVSLDPSAPEFTPSSHSIETPAESAPLTEEMEIAVAETSAETPTSPGVTSLEIPERSTANAEWPEEPAEAKASPSTPSEPQKTRLVNLVPPPPKPRAAFSSTKVSPSKPAINGTPSRYETKFYWTKKGTGDEVTDPCEALEIFCRYNRIKAPTYKSVFLPQEEVYFCLVHVGRERFKSYPTVSMTSKRAREVAAGKAVAALGITASVVALCRKSVKLGREL